jgi:hypothetical protein
MVGAIAFYVLTALAVTLVLSIALSIRVLRRISHALRSKRRVYVAGTLAAVAATAPAIYSGVMVASKLLELWGAESNVSHLVPVAAGVGVVIGTVCIVSAVVVCGLVAAATSEHVDPR